MPISASFLPGVGSLVLCGMRKIIPSLAALEIFECVARHQNLTRAAEELHLTQSAVSKQIMGLEHKLGVVLFRRVKKRIELTHYGDAYAQKIRNHLTAIERTTSQLIVQREIGASVDIAAGATFSTQWLIPQLIDFRSKYPNIVVNLTVKSDTFILNNSQFDAVIYYGDAVWQGTRGEALLPEGRIVPVCCPDLVGGQGKVSPEIVAKLALLHLSSREKMWGRWFAQAGLDNVGYALKGCRFELFTMLTSAAMAGLGVALVPEIFIHGELASGRLVVPCDHFIGNKGAYFVSYHDNPVNAEALQVFSRWLLGRSVSARSDT